MNTKEIYRYSYKKDTYKRLQINMYKICTTRYIKREKGVYKRKDNYIQKMKTEKRYNNRRNVYNPPETQMFWC